MLLGLSQEGVHGWCNSFCDIEFGFVLGSAKLDVLKFNYHVFDGKRVFGSSLWCVCYFFEQLFVAWEGLAEKRHLLMKL